LDSEAEWKEALKGIKHSFAHTWENCYAMFLTTGYNTYLYYFENKNVRIICPVAEREFNSHKDIVTPYGFSGFTGTGDCEEFEHYWKEYAKVKNYVCGYLSINPYFQNDSYFRSEKIESTASLYFLDLTLSLSDLYDNLDSNRKRQLKNFRSIESGFVYDKKVLTKFFIDNYYDFLEKINASGANYFSKSTLEFICSLENVFMVGAESGGKLTAVYVFSYTPYMGDCMFNVYIDDGKEFTSYLLWRGLKFFRSKKIPVMNLGGGSNNDDNIDKSKQRYGAFRLPFVNLKQIYDKKVYIELCKKINADPLDTGGYFPAYRKKIN